MTEDERTKAINDARDLLDEAMKLRRLGKHAEAKTKISAAVIKLLEVLE